MIKTLHTEKNFELGAAHRRAFFASRNMDAVYNILRAREYLPEGKIGVQVVCCILYSVFCYKVFSILARARI